MANVLTQEEMDAILTKGGEGRHSTPQGRQQAVQQATRAVLNGDLPGGSILSAARAQMPSGWLNTQEGVLWNWKRVEAFSRMSAGRMTFAMLKKKDKE